MEGKPLKRICPRFYIGKNVASVVNYADLLETYYRLCGLKPVSIVKNQAKSGDVYLKSLIMRLEQTGTLALPEDIGRYGGDTDRYYDLRDDFVAQEDLEPGGEAEFQTAVRERHRVERWEGEEWWICR